MNVLDVISFSAAELHPKIIKRRKKKKKRERRNMAATRGDLMFKGNKGFADCVPLCTCSSQLAGGGNPFSAFGKATLEKKK